MTRYVGMNGEGRQRVRWGRTEIDSALERRGKQSVTPTSIALLALSLISFAGCQVTDVFPERIENVPAKHIVMLGADGGFVDPTEGNFLHKHALWGNYPELKGDKVASYLDVIFKGIYADAKQQGTTQTLKLLLFVHGGLNTEKSAILRAKDMVPLMTWEDPKGGDRYYPIFINWKSNLFASYFEHLFVVRNGVRPKGFWRRAWALAMSPAYLLGDVARGFGRAPRAWGFALSSWAEEITDRTSYDREKLTIPVLGSGRERPGEETNVATNIEVIRGEGGPTTGENVAATISWIVTLPFTVLSIPLIDSFGTSAWNNMQRRTRMLFDTDEDFEDGSQNKQPGGGLSIFVKRLRCEMLKPKNQNKKWEITLVGHSMGGIILNEMLRRYPYESGEKGSLPIKKIVYLADASSLRETYDSVMPYLSANEKAEFYTASLHPAAERRESYFFDIPPRGSLLIWIDGYLTDPLTSLDKRGGRYSRFILSSHLVPKERGALEPPANVRCRVFVKNFNYGRDSGDPQKHREFSEKHFWKESFYWK